MEMAFSFGSNLGNRLENLVEGRRLLSSRVPGFAEEASAVYETEPVDVEPEFRELSYLNAVLILQAEMPVEEVATRVHAIEHELGRRRSCDRNAPRPLDIDLIYAGNCQFQQGPLCLPHPRWAERRFVVQPLADLRPERILPGQTRTVQQILLALPASPDVVFLTNRWDSLDSLPEE